MDILLALKSIIEQDTYKTAIENTLHITPVLCRNNEDLIRNIDHRTRQFVVISTMFNNADCLESIDLIQNRTERASIIVLMQDLSFPLQEAIVKRNVLCKLLVPCNPGDLIEVLHRSIEKEAVS